MLRVLERNIASFDERIVLVAPSAESASAFFKNVDVDSSRRAELIQDVQRLRGEIYLQDGAMSARPPDEPGLSAVEPVNQVRDLGFGEGPDGPVRLGDQGMNHIRPVVETNRGKPVEDGQYQSRVGKGRIVEGDPSFGNRMIDSPNVRRPGTARIRPAPANPIPPTENTGPDGRDTLVPALGAVRQPPEFRMNRIARRAHEIYTARGGEHGKAMEDWLQAEREIDAEIETGSTDR